MKEISWLDYLKLRMTYGINGNVDQASTTYFVVKKKTQSNPNEYFRKDYNVTDKSILHLHKKTHNDGVTRAK